MKGDIIYAATLLLILLLPSISFAISVTSCQNITSPGYYQLTSDLVGQPLNSSDVLDGSYACLRLNSSDIILDCNGQTITSDDNSVTSIGILTDDSSGTIFNNITVENCAVSNYSYGIYVGGIENSTVRNNTVAYQSGLGLWGFYFDGSVTDVDNVTVANNTADSYDSGFYLSGNFANDTISGNLAEYTNTGFVFSTSYTQSQPTDNSIINNVANEGESGFDIYNSINDTVANNVVSNSNSNGFSVTSQNMTFTNNTAVNGSNLYPIIYGFYFQGTGLNVTNNNAASYPYGFIIEAASNSTFDNNTAYDGYNIGFDIYGIGYSNISDNTAYNNSGVGFSVDEYYAPLYNNIYSGNNATQDSTGFEFSYIGQDNVTDNTAYNNSDMGFEMSNMDTINFTNNTAMNNTNAGFTFSTTASSLILNNTAIGNSIGLSLNASGGNSIDNNTFQENALYDLWVNSDSCGNDVSNNTGSGNRPIMFSGQQSVSLSSVDASEVILCQADGSTLDHVTADGSASLNNNGIFIVDTNGANISYPVSSNNRYGIYLLSDSGINVTNGVFNNNQFHGISLQGTDSSLIQDNTAQNNGQYDVFVNASSPLQCTNDISGTIASGGKPIAYYNQSTSLSGDNSHAEIILCDASYSSIDNVVVHGSNNDGMLVISTDYSNITNSVSSNNYLGMSFLYSSYNNISGDTTDNNVADGILLDHSDYNSLSGDTETGNGGLPIDILDSYGNLIGSPIPISSCSNLTSTGWYILNADLSINSTSDALECFNISASDVVLDCMGHQINYTGNSTSGTAGIVLSPGVIGASVLNCNVFNFSTGISGSGISYSSFDHNTINTTTSGGEGIYATGTGITLTNNVAVYTSGGGFSITSDDALIDNNTALFDYDGFELTGSGDTVTGNIANFSTNGGFSQSGDYALFENNTVVNNYGGFYLSGYSSEITNNTAINNSRENSQAAFYCAEGSSNITDNYGSGNIIGILLPGSFSSSNNYVQGNDMSGNSIYGIDVGSYSFYNNITGNLLQNNGWYDIFVDSNACTNDITDNVGSGGRPINFTNTPVSWSGLSDFSEIILCQADGSTLDHVTVPSSGHDGILLQQTSNSTINFSVSSGNFNGIYLDGGVNDTIVNSVFNSNYNGISLTQSDSNVVSNDTADNNQNGIMLTESTDNTIAGNAQENNQYDLFVHPGGDAYGSSCDNNITGVTGSGGKQVLFTNVTQNLQNNNAYSEIILCGANNSVLNGVTVSGSASLNNSGIVLINTFYSIVNQSTSSNNYNGIYLIYSDEDNITNNTLTGDVVGVRFDSSNNDTIAGNVISSSVDTGILSPAGYLDNPTHSYYPFPSSNLYGSLYSTSGSSFYDDIRNNSVTSSGMAGMFIADTGANLIRWNMVSGSGQYGLFVDNFRPAYFFDDINVQYNYTYAFISNNTITNNGWDGIRFDGHDYGYNCNGFDCSYATITNNTVAGNNYGIWQTDADYNNYSNNNATLNRYDGISIDQSSRFNTLVNNSVASNGWNGIEVYDSDQNFEANNTARNNTQDGFKLFVYANNNVLVNNTAYNNSENGFRVDGNSTSNQLSYNNATNNSNDGFLILSNSGDNTLDHDQGIKNNNNGFEMIGAAAFNTVSFSNASNNTNSGIWVYQTPQASILNNNASNNKNGNGIGLDGSSANLVSNNYVYNTTSSDGILIGYGSNYNDIYNNTAIKGIYGISIYAFSDYNDAENNTVSNATSDRAMSVGGFSNSNTVVNNVVYNNSNGGLVIWDVSTSNWLYNNTAFRDGPYGIRVDQNSNSNLLQNNTVYNTSTAGINIDNSTGNVLVGNNVSRSPRNYYISNNSAYTNITGNIAYNSSSYDFNIDNSTNCALYNNTASYAFRGYYISGGSNYTNITSNIAYNSTGQGFFVESNTAFVVLDSNSQNIGFAGYVVGSSYTLINNNTARNETYGDAFDVSGGYDNLTNNYERNDSGNYVYDLTGSDLLIVNNTASASGVTYALFLSNGVNNTFIGNNATGGVSGGGYNGFTMYGNYTTAINNSAYNTSNGFLVSSGYYANFTGNNATLAGNGYDIFNPNSTFTNNTATLCSNGFYSDYGATFELFSGDNASSGTYAYVVGGNNTFISDTASNSTIGFEFGADSNVSGSMAYNCTYGLHSNGGFGNIVANNTFTNDSYGGYLMYSATDSDYMNNSFIGNTYGFSLGYLAGDNNFSQNTFANNSKYGLQINQSDEDVMSGDHFSNNGRDLIAMNYSVLNMSYVVFDSPSGDYQNFTNLSINNTANDTGFTINWTTNESVLPNGAFSFAQKFVNISPISAPVNLDSVSFSWLASELPGYDEAIFQLVEYNSTGWYVINDTPDTMGHTLSYTDLSPESDYGILQNGQVCPVINSSGTYLQPNNYAGASNDASEITSGAMACVKILASDVVYDCNGFTITGDSPVSIGVLVENASNVTVQNCNVTSYTYGNIYASYSNDSLFVNDTILDNPDFGIALDHSDGNTIVNDSIGSTYDTGFYLLNSSNNTVINNSIDFNDNFGYFLDADSDNNTVIGNTIRDSHSVGFPTYGSSGNVIEYNTIVSQDNVGFASWFGSTNDSFIGNTVGNATDVGFYVTGSDELLDNNSVLASNNIGFEIAGNDTLTNDFGQDCADAAFYIYGDNNTLVNDTANASIPTVDGFMVGSSGNLLINNTISNISGYGFDIVGDSNVMINNTALNEQPNADFAIPGYGFYINGNNMTSSGNSVYNSSDYGFFIGTANSSFSGDIAQGAPSGFFISTYYDSGVSGYVLPQSDNLSNETAYGNGVGIDMNGSNGTFVDGGHLYGNGFDMLINDSTGSPLSVGTSGMIFDNPSGSMENFTNLSINDTVNDGESYSVTWTANETVPPHQSFAQKFVNMTTLSGAPSIDSAVWSWLASELPGYSEHDFRLWGYNSTGWFMLNDTPDTIGHTLSYNLSPDGDYGILTSVAAPLIAFVPPTPDNGTITYDQSILVNISVNETSFPLGDLVFDWNGSSAQAASTNLSQIGGEEDTITLSCPAGTTISSYTSRWGITCASCGGGNGVDCGTCAPGNTSCTVTYGSGQCGGDCNFGCYKPSELNLTCTSTPNDTMYNPDLVLMYNFDNVSSLGEDNSHVTDMSMYGNNATCTDPDCPVWTPDGEYGGAYAFDGVQDYFTAGNLDQNLLTVSAWINKGSDSGENMYILHSQNDGGFGFGVTTDNHLYLEWRGHFTTSSTATVTDGVWHLVSVSYDGAHAIFYIDGVQAGISDFSVSYGGGGNYFIGTSGDGDSYFNGTMDELRVYNRSLLPTEIQQLYTSNLNKYDSGKWDFISNRSFGVFPVGDYNFTYFGCASDTEGNENCTENREITYRVIPPLIAFAPPTPDDGITILSNETSSIPINVSVNMTTYQIGNGVLDFNGTNYTMPGGNPALAGDSVLIYDFDDNTTNVTDASPSGDNASCSGSCPVWTPDGKYGGSFQFDGYSQYLTTNDNLDMNQFTLSAWVKRDGTGNTPMILGAPNGWGVYFESDNTLHLTHVGFNNVGSAGTVADTTSWHHVAVTYDGSEVMFYIDGVFAGEQPYTDTFVSGGPYTVGALDYYGLQDYFNGKIDDLRVYDRALSDAEISNLYSTSAYSPDFYYSANITPRSPYGISNLTYYACAYDIEGNQNCTETRSILFDNFNCPIINESGTFVQDIDYHGAPNDASEMPEPGMACVKITSSNVVYDCNGHTITNDGTGGTTYGVLLNGSLTNVTLQNCPGINSYDYGVYSYQSSGNVFTNITASDNTAIKLVSDSSDNVTSNTIIGGTGDGIDLFSSPGCMVSGNDISNDSGTGISFYSDSDNGTIQGNTLAYLGGNGITIDTTFNISVLGNDIHNGSNVGIALQNGASNNYISGNNMTMAGWSDLYMYPGSTPSENNTITNNSMIDVYSENIEMAYNEINNTISDNVITNPDYGVSVYPWNNIYMSYSSDNTISNNTMSDGGSESGNYEAGEYNIYINSGSGNNTFSGNTLSQASYTGIYLEYDWLNPKNNTFSDNVLSQNQYGFFVHWNANDLFINNTVSNSSIDGMFIYDSNGTTKQYVICPT